MTPEPLRTTVPHLEEPGKADQRAVVMIDLSNGVPGINAPDPSSFEEFWPYYLSQHLHPATRQVHVVGDSTTLVSIVLGIIAGRMPRSVAAKLAVLGFGLGVASHFIFEKNSPLDTDRKARNPLWLGQSDLRLLWLAYTGRLDRDVEAVRAALGLSPDELTLASTGGRVVSQATSDLSWEDAPPRRRQGN